MLLENWSKTFVFLKTWFLRYGVFDFEYTHQCQGTTEASKKEKLFLISWCPDSAKIKKKMLYASSLDNLKKSLVGVHKFIQVCCTGTNIIG